MYNIPLYVCVMSDDEMIKNKRILLYDINHKVYTADIITPLSYTMCVVYILYYERYIVILYIRGVEI
jgi:hypothetical protein